MAILISSYIRRYISDLIKCLAAVTESIGGTDTVRNYIASFRAGCNTGEVGSADMQGSTLPLLSPSRRA